MVTVMKYGKREIFRKVKKIKFFPMFLIEDFRRQKLFGDSAKASSTSAGRPKNCLVSMGQFEPRPIEPREQRESY